MDSIRVVLRRLAKKADAAEFVLLSAMRGERIAQRGVALLIEIAPDEINRQIALWARGRQLRPHVLFKFFLVERKRKQRVGVAPFDRGQHGPRKHFRRLMRVGKRPGGSATPTEEDSAEDEDMNTHETERGQGLGQS